MRRGAGVAQGVCRRLLGQVGQTAEVKERGFGSLRCLRLLHLDEVGTPDDVVQLREAHLGERFPYLFGKEVEEVDEVVGPSVEALPQLLVLGGDAYRAGVQMALAHHHAPQYDEGRCGEAVLLRPEQGHEDDVATRLQLSVCLEAHLPAQVVHHQRLLRFR